METAGRPPRSRTGATRGAMSGSSAVRSVATRSADPGIAAGGAAPVAAGLSDFEAGVLVGILVGEGHFGGDGRQPQVTLRMHTAHAALFAWLMARFPDARLYGPYHHGGRSYYQWMARGTFLRDTLMPILRRRMSPELSARVWTRYAAMCDRYGLSPVAGEAALGSPGGPD